MGPAHFIQLVSSATPLPSVSHFTSLPLPCRRLASHEQLPSLQVHCRFPNRQGLGRRSSWATILIVMQDSEAVFWCQAGHNNSRQVEWLARELARANAPAARSVRPWLVAYVHRPLWTSQKGSGMTCNTTEQSRMRLVFEQLLHEGGVDLVLTGHNHMYERTWPIYNGTVLNGTADPADPYHDPHAAVHLVSAAGGNGESMDPFDPVKPPFAAFRSINNRTCGDELCSDYGFSTLGFANSSAVEVSFWSYGDGRDVMAPMVRTDHFWLRQSAHGPRARKPADV